MSSDQFDSFKSTGLKDEEVTISASNSQMMGITFGGGFGCHDPK